jgi:lysozyme
MSNPSIYTKSSLVLTKDIVNFVADYEAFSPVAYLPTPNDVLTIGFGHTRNVKPGMVITREKAKELLLEEMFEFAADVKNLVKVNLTQNQFDAIVSLVYNVGTTSFRNSQSLKRLNSGDYEGFVNGAFHPTLGWVKQKGKILKGLVRRRADEARIFKDSVYERTV